MLPMSRHHFTTGVIALVSQPLMRTCANFRVQGHSVFRQQGNEECIDDSSGMPGCSNRHRTRDIWHVLKPGTLELRNTWYVKTTPSNSVLVHAVIFRFLERRDVIGNFRL